MARVDLQPDVPGARRVAKGDHVISQFGPYIVMYSWPKDAYFSTPEREVSKSNVKSVGEAWRALTPEAKSCWLKYARTFVTTKRREYPGGWTNGYNMFMQAFNTRKKLGLPAPVEPVWRTPPGAIDAVVSVPAGDPAGFSFQFLHAYGASHDYAVTVKITAGTPSIAAAPKFNLAVLICGNNVNSTRLLPASGDIVTFENPRRSVKPGERFGLIARIVRLADGIAGPEMRFDLFRK